MNGYPGLERDELDRLRKVELLAHKLYASLVSTHSVTEALDNGGYPWSYSTKRVVELPEDTQRLFNQLEVAIEEYHLAGDEEEWSHGEDWFKA
jgi:hypothetical protein